MCPNGGTCYPSTAGQQWAYVARDVQSWISSQGWSSQITIWAGSDFEQRTSYSTPDYDNWDCPLKTKQFVDGYNYGGATGYRLVDFGSAWTGLNCDHANSGPPWTTNDVYYIAWGATSDWPLPETYSQYAVNSWLAVEAVNGSQGRMRPVGVMTECSTGDVLPTSNCWVQGNGQNEFAPRQGWDTLRLGLRPTYLSTLWDYDYAVNIKWQP